MGVQKDLEAGLTDMNFRFWNLRQFRRAKETQKAQMARDFERLQVEIEDGKNAIVVCHGSAILEATKMYNLYLSRHKEIMNVETFEIELGGSVTPGKMTRHGGILENEEVERADCHVCDGFGEVEQIKCYECKGHGKLVDDENVAEAGAGDPTTQPDESDVSSDYDRFV